MKDNIVGPMMVYGYEIPAETVAQAINWMTDGGWFEAAALRNFLVARWHFVECAGDYKDEIIYIAADRIIAKAKRDGLIEFDKLYRVWRKVQK